MSLNSTMYIGATGLSTYSTAMGVVSDNVANSNTTAYKSNSVRFGDMVGGYMPITTRDSDHMGAGVSILGNFTNFSQGSISSTSNWSDLAVNGEGYFKVAYLSNGQPTGDIYYTRDGSFHVDDDGYLVNNSGMAVLNNEEEPIKVLEYPDDPEYNDFYVDSDGQIYGSRIRTLNVTSTAETLSKASQVSIDDDNETLTLQAGDPVDLTYEVSDIETGTALTINVYDEDNNIVRTETIRSSSTVIDPWDYTAADMTASGLTAGDCTYQVTRVHDLGSGSANLDAAGGDIDFSYDTEYFPEGSDLYVTFYDALGAAVGTPVTITADSSGTTTWTYDAAALTAAGLTAGVDYTYKITGVQTVGSGNATLDAAGGSVNLSYDAEDMPEGTDLTVTFTDSTPTSWTPPSFDSIDDVTWTWDGADNGLSALPTGEDYTYKISTSDGLEVGSGTAALNNSVADDFNVTYTLSGNPATDSYYVAYNIYDSDGNLVRTIANSETQAAGTYTDQVIWDGTDDDGNKMSPGDYTVSVYTAPTSGGVASVEYDMIADADVTFKVYDENGDLVTTVTSEGQTEGSHTWSWNGRDSEGIPVAPGTYTYVVSTSKDNKSEAIASSQIHLTVVTNEDGLVREGTNLYSMGAEAGTPIDSGDSWENSVGKIVDYSLESSNVDLAVELVNMIIYQSTYNANSKSITTASDMIDTTVNLVR
jgi:flagellar hook protein FlgE